MEERVKQLLHLATKIAREFDNIPGLPHAGIELTAQEALAHAARLFDPARERLETMGFHGIDTLGFLKSGCGVPPQTVPGGVSPPAFLQTPPQVDDFAHHP